MDETTTSSFEPAPRLRVLMIGGGGRDHALCAAFARSPRLRELHAAPGNAGIARIATCHPLELDDHDAMVALAVELQPDLVVIGAEDLLVAGVASRIQQAGITCLGPTVEAARLEGSKLFAKQLMERGAVATPAWRSCDDVESAHRAIDELGGAVAVKADGLAAGCGAFVCPTPERARRAVRSLMVDKVFGDAGSRVIVEQLVDGAEVSVMALVDGTNVVPLPPARDYKRLADGDVGPNTGGMGAHAPSTDLSGTASAQLAVEVIQPIVDQLAATGALGGVDAIAAHGAAVAVCVAAEHYPELQLEPAPVRVTGIDAASRVPGVELHVGLAEPGATADEMLALGGRVVSVSAWAEDMPTAIERAYAAADLVQVAGRQLRRDIGQPALEALAAPC